MLEFDRKGGPAGGADAPVSLLSGRLPRAGLLDASSRGRDAAAPERVVFHGPPLELGSSCVKSESCVAMPERRGPLLLQRMGA